MGISVLLGCATPSVRPPERQVEQEDEDVPPDRVEMIEADRLADITEKLVVGILANPALTGERPLPILMLGEVVNETPAELDADAFIGQFRTLMARAGRVMFVNEQRRQGLWESYASSNGALNLDEQIGIGQQLGAQLLLTATLEHLGELDVESGLQPYKMRLVLTDLASGQPAWKTHQRFYQEPSEPLEEW